MTENTQKDNMLVVVEKHLLRDAGICIDESVPFDIYRTMYPDILAVPHDMRDPLIWGMFQDEYSSILIVCLLFQRKAAHIHHATWFLKDALAPLKAFRDAFKNLEFTEENFDEPVTAREVTADIQYVFEDFSFADDEMLFYGVTAIFVYLCGQFLREGSKAKRLYVEAMEAADLATAALREQCIKVA